MPVAMGLALLGCAEPTRLADGARCTRTVECGPGLLCNGGICTTDRTGYGIGTVPTRPMDAGPATDAFAEGTDAFVEPIDAYAPPGTDAFTPDAFSPTPDAFTPTPDAFTPADDPDASP